MEKQILSFFIAMVFHKTIANFPNIQQKHFTDKPLSDLGDPLILTPYLEAGDIDTARCLSNVALQDFANITTSYSGYFTVDKESNSNLFFWFFPSADNFEEDPVLLWLNGGPGTSSLLGLFDEHGPFSADWSDNPDDHNLYISARNYSWHKNHSVLYIDQPVGTGFSFTDGAYLETQTQISKHMYSALIQFFTLFPELQDNDFFATGESYAGKYIPSISYYIYQKNEEEDRDITINLQGIVIGNGFTDPLNMAKYGDLLYQLGLIDAPTLDIFHDAEALLVEQINEGNYSYASATWARIVGDYFSEYANVDVYNFLEDYDVTSTSWINYVTQDYVREGIHVANQTYNYASDDVYDALWDDVSKSYSHVVAELLSNYRVLIYNGQLDIICGYPLTANYIQKMNFSAAEEYKTAKREFWHVNNKLAGYVKTAGNLTEVLVRDAGHFVPTDQPEYGYDLIYNFVRNNPIVRN